MFAGRPCQNDTEKYLIHIQRRECLHLDRMIMACQSYFMGTQVNTILSPVSSPNQVFLPA